MIFKAEMGTGLTSGESSGIPITADNGSIWSQRGSCGGVEGTPRAAELGRVVASQRLRGRRGNGVPGMVASAEVPDPGDLGADRCR